MQTLAHTHTCLKICVKFLNILFCQTDEALVSGCLDIQLFGSACQIAVRLSVVMVYVCVCARVLLSPTCLILSHLHTRRPSSGHSLSVSVGLGKHSHTHAG